MGKIAPLKTRRAAPTGVRSEVRRKESRVVDRTGQNQQGMVTHRQKELGQRLTMLFFLKKRASSDGRVFITHMSHHRRTENWSKKQCIFILLLKTRDSHTKFS